ncbi:MAG: hypothetical protein QG577_632, partial [Thermodesulfobacteriota bacterium]|nr:hypothetical protein [Thermodesulfobacteriota bacterium]
RSRGDKALVREVWFSSGVRSQQRGTQWGTGVTEQRFELGG